MAREAKVINKILTFIGMFSISMSLLFVGSARIAAKKLNLAEEKKDNYINEFVASDEWKNLKGTILQKVSMEFNEGKISLKQYNDIQQSLNDKNEIEKLIYDEELAEIEDEIKEQEELVKKTKNAVIAGTSVGCSCLIVRIIVDKYDQIGYFD